jgi:hypothetical protein
MKPRVEIEHANQQPISKDTLLNTDKGGSSTAQNVDPQAMALAKPLQWQLR